MATQTRAARVPHRFEAREEERTALREAYDDLMAYRRQRHAEHERAMIELVRLTEELDLYDD